jgi:hypothetical protein
MNHTKLLADKIDRILSNLADYERINIDKFYDDVNNKDLLNSLDLVLKNDMLISIQDEVNIIDLYNELDSFIQFSTEYNSRIGDF